MVGVGDSRTDEGGCNGPGVVTATAGLAAKDVPDARHEVGTEGDHHDELE